ncbi:hypothetical protein CAF53_02580 [Sphingobium sp. LB126]|uniref:deazapurine DNA modification protein DpdA family protein n=1 Tax=Sphingobium sp. LB126 TaxID=1983755 RepID=UPI000C20F9FE|nr:hypothetical protein [Sphingobium sp. LB126]PJG47247.1 hypothetical protein CAF53_02580 [Sphingobium sp. LB126]
MAIEIIVGLPHLNEGPILERVRDLGQPALVSANALSWWSTVRGWPEWLGWRIAKLAHANGLASLDLDSAGFVAMKRYGGFAWSIDQYFQLASAFPFRRIASLDYCTEHEIAEDREEVLDRISRTIRANRDCRDRAADLGLQDRFMPVLQGRTPADYERCADGLWWSMRPGAVVGVGSMCRREVGGPNGLVAVVDHLDSILPRGVRLHIFGAKGAALPWLKAFGDRVASIDSQAYGVAARRDAYRRRISKSDKLVADHLQRWCERQFERLDEPARRIPRIIQPIEAPPILDPWETAVATAREEIRALIESGNLDHDEMTNGWIEQWAADIYHAA